MQKSSLAEANEKRDWRIYQDLVYVLIKKAKAPGATLHHGKGGFKMHTLMDLNGSIQTFIRLTEASVYDSKILEEVPVEPNAYYLMDKGYVKFDTLTGYYTTRKYPDNLGLVVYEDFKDGTVYRFLTNNFTLEAIAIAELYRERWQIEIFFKWIK